MTKVWSRSLCVLFAMIGATMRHCIGCPSVVRASSTHSARACFSTLDWFAINGVLFGIFAIGVQTQRGLKQLPIQFRIAPPGRLIRVQTFSIISDGLLVPSA